MKNNICDKCSKKNSCPLVKMQKKENCIVETCFMFETKEKSK